MVVWRYWVAIRGAVDASVRVPFSIILGGVRVWKTVPWVCILHCTHNTTLCGATTVPSHDNSTWPFRFTNLPIPTCWACVAFLNSVVPVPCYLYLLVM